MNQFKLAGLVFFKHRSYHFKYQSLNQSFMLSITALKAPLSQEICHAYMQLMKYITPLHPASRTLKEIEGTGGKISVNDLIAYQIGWGKCVIRWYETGIQGQIPTMPGEGFSKWDYVAIAQHFYQKYHYPNPLEQNQIFDQTVRQLLYIVEKEHQTGCLDQIGIWPWCTLQSGKQWPLSKWIKINSSSAYKRATSLVKNFHLT